MPAPGGQPTCTTPDQGRQDSVCQGRVQTCVKEVPARCVLKQRYYQAEMRDEYGMKGARGGHHGLSDYGDKIEYTPEPEYDDGSKPDYDDHDLEDRDPYY